MIVGFTGGGWTTRGTSQATADAAVLNARAAICVAQFSKPPSDQRMKALKAAHSWERAEDIGKRGWDRMPGEEKAEASVARACAEALGVVLEK